MNFLYRTLPPPNKHLGDAETLQPDSGILSSWAGLTPKHRESDTVVHRGPITKQGSTLVRWAAVEAAQGARNADWLTQTHARIAERRGRNIATVAVALRVPKTSSVLVSARLITEVGPLIRSRAQSPPRRR